MRDPNRIDHVVETIRRVWHLVPDWRLGQLVCNLARECGAWDSFYMEDDMLEDAARSWIKQNEDLHRDIDVVMVNKKNYPEFMDAVNAAVELCDGQNFEIRRNSDQTYDLIWTTVEEGEQK